MAIPKSTRDQLLVEARHRCTICAEKCFELHHIVEQAEGGSDDAENLIVLCPNCHQHRYHRSGEFTRDQLRLYKEKLKEQNEVERRLLLNLEELRLQIGKIPAEDVETRLRLELSEAASQVSERSPSLSSAVKDTSRWLGERELLKGGARKAIEVEWELERARAKAKYPPISILAVDEDGWEKADEFPRAYSFVLELDRRPGADWVDVFNNEYRHSFYSMKRSTRVRGDRLVMIVADSDDLQGHVDFAKGLVERTNGFIQRHIFSQIDRQVERGKAAALREFDTLKSLRAATRNLKI